MLKYTELNLEKKRDLVKAHEANVRAKKNAIKWKADNPSATSATTSPTSSGDGPSKDAKQAKFDEVRFFLRETRFQIGNYFLREIRC